MTSPETKAVSQVKQVILIMFLCIYSFIFKKKEKFHFDFMIYEDDLCLFQLFIIIIYNEHFLFYIQYVQILHKYIIVVLRCK